MASTIDFKVIDEILSRRPRDERSTIAILQDIQEVYHYLPREAFPYVAKAIGVGEARLYGVATFYENFSLEPKGKYVIRCCDGTACHARTDQVYGRARHGAGQGSDRSVRRSRAAYRRRQRSRQRAEGHRSDQGRSCAL